MLKTDQLERFYMRLYKELSDDERYWTKDTILNLIQQMIDLSRKFDEREKEREQRVKINEEEAGKIRILRDKINGTDTSNG